MQDKLDTQDALVHAARTAFPRSSRRRSDPAMLKLANETMEADEVRPFLVKVFERAGLSFFDAVKKHIDHIKGGTESNPDGSYQALKDYEQMVLPKQPTRIEQKSVSYSVTPSGGAPAVRARKVVTEITGGKDES